MPDVSSEHAMELHGRLRAFLLQTMARESPATIAAALWYELVSLAAAGIRDGGGGGRVPGSRRPYRASPAPRVWRGPPASVTVSYARRTLKRFSNASQTLLKRFSRGLPSAAVCRHPQTQGNLQGKRPFWPVSPRNWMPSSGTFHHLPPSAATRQRVPISRATPITTAISR
jgi:hypothetical protein